MIQEREQTVSGCLIGSIVGVLVYAVVSIMFVLLVARVPVLPDIPAKLGITRSVELTDIFEVKVPGEVHLELEPGIYKIYSRRSVPLAYNIKVNSEASGEPVELKRAGRIIVEITQGRSGLQLFTFEVKQSGNYVIVEDNVASDTILIAPVFDRQNRIVSQIFYGALSLMLMVVVISGAAYWRWKNRERYMQIRAMEQAHKEKAAEKRQKWDDIMKG